MRVTFASVESFMERLGDSFLRNESIPNTFSPEQYYLSSSQSNSSPSRSPSADPNVPLRSILRVNNSSDELDTFMDGLDARDMFATGFNQSRTISLMMILGSAVIGIVLGYILDGYDPGEDAKQWITLPGNLFISALQCLVVPMVFCSIVTCIAEFIAAGHQVAVGTRTILTFGVMTLISSSIGTFFGWLFFPFFAVQDHMQYGEYSVPVLSFKCFDGKFLARIANGSIACIVGQSQKSSTHLELDDLTSTFVTKPSTYVNLSVTHEIFSLLYQLIPTNVLEAFVEGSTLGVISFAIVFGIAITKSFSPTEEVAENYPLLLITQVGILVRMILNGVMTTLPVAVISLLAGAIVILPSSLQLVSSVAYFTIALVLALSLITFGILGFVLLVTTRRNVFSYLKAIIPAQIFIASYCSSVATLPVTIRCVESTREVPTTIARFILSLGASCNLNGTAAYMPLACLFMAKVSGIEAHFTPMTYVRLAFVSAIASYGVAPVPHSGLVMVMTIWKTVFHTDVPPVFSFVVGMDWLLNRICSVVNISNHALLARIIAGRPKETATAVRRVSFITNQPQNSSMSAIGSE